MLSPVEKAGKIWMKREDKYSYGGEYGGKVRSCRAIATQKPRAKGLVTAGSRHSPQVAIVAAVAAKLNLPCTVFVPSGEETAEIESARGRGAKVVRAKVGYNNYLNFVSSQYAQRTGFRLIPFGMRSQTAVAQTAGQVANIPASCKRIVLPVGSGMTLAGILHGLRRRKFPWVRVLGVVVGADPTKQLDRFAPADWREKVQLVRSALKYEQRPPVTSYAGVPLDPVYEAKCIPYLRAGDCLWLVGIRGSLRHH